MPEGNVTRKRLKCPECYLVAYEEQIENFGGKDGKQPICPACGQPMVPLCVKDHPCTCLNPIKSGAMFCPECGEAICPECGSHDVMQVSRVTGYLQDVKGWNAGKLQELKDRHRTDILNGIPS